MKALVIDGYVDEPSAFGVPPYVSHYVRYVSGLLLMKGIDVSYLTIDQIRSQDMWGQIRGYDYVVIVGGITVPGRYVGGIPIREKEIQKILRIASKSIKVMVGAVSHFFADSGGFPAREARSAVECVVKNDVVTDLYEFLFGKPLRDNYWETLLKASIEGTSVLSQHPRYPNVICEIELSRGCERQGHCSFCIEPVFFPKLVSRPVEHVLSEIEALYKARCRAFRFGRSSNVLAYYFDRNNYKPCPAVFEDLYSGIWEVAPSLQVLHHDNANASFLTKFPRECMKILNSIVNGNTPGDVLSFGIESFDEKVLHMNNVGITPQEAFRALQMVNEIGAKRVKGVPKLLPGINLLHGLIGESPETFKENIRWLRKIAESGLLLRRINIRKAIVEPKTPLWRYTKGRALKISAKDFHVYKETIRKEIDLPMIKKVFPVGTVLRRVYPEYKKGKLTFARQLGTYPVLVGIPRKLSKPEDIVIVDHGPRSVTGVTYPLNLNQVTFEELTAIPRIGAKRAERVILNRPFQCFTEVEKALEDVDCIEVLTQLRAVLL
ncbi:MAG: radical SAM protein [Thermotogaceae bacterium]|nr:radical SAM protein [Thermotogaceae bacterium]